MIMSRSIRLATNGIISLFLWLSRIPLRLPWWLSGKESACSAGDPGSIPGLEPPGEGHAAHSSILAWRTPWTEEPGGLRSTASHRVRHNGVTKWLYPAARVPRVFSIRSSQRDLQAVSTSRRVNSAAVDTGMRVSLCIIVLSRYMPRSGH